MVLIKSTGQNNGKIDSFSAAANCTQRMKRTFLWPANTHTPTCDYRLLMRSQTRSLPSPLLQHEGEEKGSGPHPPGKPIRPDKMCLIPKQKNMLEVEGGSRTHDLQIPRRESCHLTSRDCLLERSAGGIQMTAPNNC